MMPPDLAAIVAAWPNLPEALQGRNGGNGEGREAVEA